MKWRVRFRHEQHQCCPDLYYWIVRTQEVEADNEMAAENKIMDTWGWDGRVEIKHTERIDD